MSLVDGEQPRETRLTLKHGLDGRVLGRRRVFAAINVRRQRQRLSDFRRSFKVFLDAVRVEGDAEPRRFSRGRQDPPAQLVVSRLDGAELPDDDAGGDDDAEQGCYDGVGHPAFVAFDSENNSI